MNSGTFRNLARLLERWPIDPTKTGRDFGEFIRHQITNSFQAEKANILQLETWDKINESLTRISKNTYKKKFDTNISSALGLSLENCQKATSNEFLEQAQIEYSKGLKGRIQNYFRD